MDRESATGMTGILAGADIVTGMSPASVPAVPAAVLDPADAEAIGKPWRDACERAQDAYVFSMETMDRVGESAHRDVLRARLRYHQYAEVVNAIDGLLAYEAAWVRMDAQHAARGVS